MNALQILQKVYRRAGGPGSIPSSITSVSGFSEDCMDWVNTAWRWTQALRQDWWWKWVTTQQTLTIGQSQYDLSADFSLTDVRSILMQEVVVWDPSKGTPDQVIIKEREAIDWRAKWDLGDQTNHQRPTEVAHLEDGKLGFGPWPDLAYNVRFRYYQQNTDFTTNNDIPGIPVEYHELIVWRALMLWAGQEENQLKFRHFENESQRWEKLLNADPRIGTGYGNASGNLG